MNNARAQLLTQARQGAREAQMDGKRPSMVRIPPKRREIATLSDWVADHPENKRSKALQQIQEAYYESCGVSYSH